MSEITKAIEARQAQIVQLQNDIEILQRAAGIMGGGTMAPAKATRQPRTRRTPKPETQPTPQPKTKRKRRQWSAAEKAAIGKRMKKYWAKRRKAKR